ncbi:Tn3 family transposase [Clostridium vincentii]|uniref:Tn3 transposase DDE domain protein n=1 Tax=Clostridium vincentii TaxID=52704 RepID=A0A2T0BB96_9CLOT|nr:Tn3 family transposase [Clostridium vincentii]PRR81176.1 Tn3 transposase DDE domain protein [Clostridium vincentii]
MAGINETAYPRFKSIITENDLKNVYTPTFEEILYANEVTRNQKNRLQFLIMLKAYQRLGYPTNIVEVPQAIINHIVNTVGINHVEFEFEKYDKSLTRLKHLEFIRKFLNIKPYGKEAIHIAIKVAADASKTKDNDADIINIVIDELIHQRFELPAFSTLIRLSRKVRHTVYTAYYKHVSENISDETKQLIDKLFSNNQADTNTGWNVLKEDPGKLNPDNLSQILEVFESIKAFNIKEHILSTIPDVKLKHFVNASEALNASKMKELEEHKRYTLAVTFITQKYANILDDIGEMFVKLVKSRQNKARDKQIEYKLAHSKTACNLITTLKDIMIAYKTEGNKEERFDAIAEALKTQNTVNPDEIINKCEIHNTYAGDNYFPFAWDCIKGKCRVTLFKVLDNVELYSTTQDKTMEDVITIIRKNRKSARLEKIPKEEFKDIDLSWISEKWTKLLTGHTGKVNDNEDLNRRRFEVCAFYEIMQDLKSGDLCIKGSDKYSDYREQLINLEEYDQEIKTYGEQVGIPVTSVAFAQHVKTLLSDAANSADTSFPSNQYLRIQKGEPILTPLKKKEEPKDLKLIKSLLADKMKQVSILDILYTSQQWYNWTKFFGPLSGYDSKLDDPVERYLTTAFCYGCNLGPSQTANSLDTITRKQVSYINQWHISSDKIDDATNHIINLYKKFNILKYWGTGERVAADGTIWEIFERNILSERHIRYGVNGAIGYYHISDLYIALFSKFIPCGVWEGVYILDLLMNEKVDIKPHIIHADTQGQNETIFGLSFLLGIELMPRIRNWKHLKFYKSDKANTYEHIDELFTDNIDWELIKTYLPDMLRVALSIKMGRITPSTILRKLGSYSRKNKLYQAFSELGKAVRTGFLLKYISDIDSRRIIQETSNKNESFNGFTKWINFGSDGVIRSNNREDQRKRIKYNHLVANTIIFYNVYHMSEILHGLSSEGYDINKDIVSSLAPYMTSHINRFGKYSIDKNLEIPELKFDIDV